MFSRFLLALLVALSFASARLEAQANDHCLNATVAANGNNPGNNFTASTGPEPIPGCGAMLNDVWFSYTATCTGIVIASLCPPGSANFDTVMAAWSGSCNCLTEIACNDDYCGLASRITFGVVAGVTYYISIGGFDGEVGSFALNIQCGTGSPPNVPLVLAFTTSGPGTLGYDLSGGPPNGIGFVGITPTQGAFPNGPFFGIALSQAELSSEIAAGFPFLTTLSPCGSVSAGPYGGLPPGLTIYAVALAAPAGYTYPVQIGTPMSATVF
jgi:hypothetical protein